MRSRPLRPKSFGYVHIITKAPLEDSPSFDLELTDELPLKVTDSQETLDIASGSLTLSITRKNWSMTYLRNGEVITRSTGRDLALMKTDWKGYAYDHGDNEETYMRQMLSLSVGELVYGMGERFTPFVKNGQSVDIWNADGGTSTEQSYKNIPFYLSSRGYGVFVNHPEQVDFEVGTEQVNKAGFSVAGEMLDYYL